MKATYFIPTIVAFTLYFMFLFIGLPKRNKSDYRTVASNKTTPIVSGDTKKID